MVVADQDLQPDAAGRVGGGVSLPPLPPEVSASSVVASSSIGGAHGMFVPGGAVVVVVVATLLPEVEDASLARPRKHGGAARRRGRRVGAWRRGDQTTDRFLPLRFSVEERCVRGRGVMGI